MAGKLTAGIASEKLNTPTTNEARNVVKKSETELRKTG
jgi:hypothetical protein